MKGSKVFVEALKGIFTAVAEKSLQDIDCLQVISDFAPRRQLEVASLESIQGIPNFMVTGAELEECLRLEKERPMISYVVNDRKSILPLRLSEAPAKLLKPENS